jgi:diacylglycerol kinase (ATP)
MATEPRGDTQEEPRWRAAEVLNRRPAPQKTVTDSFSQAMAGVVHAFRTQRHMRAHLLIIAIVFGGVLFFDLKAVEVLIVFFAISLVISTELLNTAVEMAVDLFNPQYHPLARLIKDIAAGAVLVASGNALVVGCVIFLRPIRWQDRLEQIRGGSTMPGAEEEFLLVASGMAVLALCVVVIKGMTKRGRVFAGGAVSGHSALAFFVATSILFLTASWGIAGLAFALAILIAQSRIQGRIHSLDETVIGGVLGIAVGTLVFAIGHAF